MSDAIEEAGFKPNLVSDADDIGIIQKRIIQNLYDNPIVVCDVSGRNPNVMFELGMRLAFDKPTIIVKDYETPYSFDTSPIEHLEYPRDLRYNLIVEFKAELAKKIKATYEKANSDPDYTPFLGHFGQFIVAKLEANEVSLSEAISGEIAEMRLELRGLAKQITTRSGSSAGNSPKKKSSFNNPFLQPYFTGGKSYDSDLIRYIAKVESEKSKDEDSPTP